MKMAKGFDKGTAKNVYKRMQREGSSLRYIQDVLQEVYPEAKEEEILLFLASCINEPSEPVVVSPHRPRRNVTRESISHQDTSCTGSSNLNHC